MRKWTWNKLPHHIQKEFLYLQVRMGNLQAPDVNEGQWVIRNDKALYKQWRAMTAESQHYYLKTLRDNWRSLADSVDRTIFRMIERKGQ